MGVFSVPVTIGVDEERISKEIEKNVESQVINSINEEIKKIIFKNRYGFYGNEFSDEPLRRLITDEINSVLNKNEDKIVKLASEILADKLARTKVVKEAAAEAIKNKCAEEE